MKQLLEIKTIIHHAQAANKPIALLKGIALSLRLYQNLHVRTSGDIDLLVSKDDIFWFDRLLKMLGYELKTINAISPRRHKALIYYNKDLEYFHPIKKMRVELHWKLSLYNELLVDYDKLLNENTETINCNEFLIPVLPKRLDFIYNCFHAEAHRGEKLSWLYDSLQYAKIITPNEWTTVFSEAKQYAVLQYLSCLYERWVYYFPKHMTDIPAFPVAQVLCYPHKVITDFVHEKNNKFLITVIATRNRLFIVNGLKNKIKGLNCNIQLYFLSARMKYNIPAFVIYLYFPLYFLIKLMTIATGSVKHK